MNNIINIYISPDGCDSASGSNTEPLKTPAAAIAKARALRKEIQAKEVNLIFSPGEYRTGSLRLGKEDSGSANCPVTFKAAGKNVIFSGSALLPSDKFRKVSGKAAERLSPEARENVYVLDLAELSISKDDIGPVGALGAWNTSCYYDGGVDGGNCEVFFNSKRMQMARYPNSGFSTIRDVTDPGESVGNRNANGGTITVDDEMWSRISKWKEPEKAWLFGYFFFDWSDSSTPIEKINYDTKEIKLKYVFNYGLRKDTEYYAYNVLEELDEPGEYYLDRDNLLLYIYPLGDMSEAKAELSLLNDLILDAENTDYITLDGITFSGTRADGIHMKGSHITLKNCTIRNVAGWAAKLFGEYNSVLACEIAYTGKGGIALYGGNPGKLTSGHCLAKDNYIHDFSEVFKTACFGVEIGGCGNRIAHNLIENCPQTAIWYSGPDNVIEYNHIRHAVQQSNDSGAIYNGRDWASYGSVIRYNIFEDTGNEHYHPVAIYWDDTLSGQTAFGNIISTSSAKGFLAGGGRDNKIINNLILDCNEYAILFDRRGIDWHDRWLEHREPQSLWTRFCGLKVKKAPWSERFPWLKSYHADTSRTDDIDFVGNPSRAGIRDNVIVYHGNSDVFRGIDGCLIEPDVIRFGDVENNPVFSSREECLIGETFELNEKAKALVPGFERIPVEKIGRFKD